MGRKLEKEHMAPIAKTPSCIGIVGLGLIGGSLGLDLQSLGYQVKGLTNRPHNVSRATARGLAQEVSSDQQILQNCDLIILALPLNKLLKPNQKLIKALPKSAVITDVGSIKGPVLKVWNELHPKFVGGHPMAGTSANGVEAGEKGLFKNQPWVATPDLHTDPQALKMVNELAIQLGSSWLTTTADTHDQAVALISHLPVMVSAALLRSVGEEANQEIRELAVKLASSGFADTTRVGGGNPDLGTAMATFNTSAILRGLSSYRSSLEKIETAIIKEDWYELQKELQRTQALRPNFLNH